MSGAGMKLHTSKLGPVFCTLLITAYRFYRKNSSHILVRFAKCFMYHSSHRALVTFPYKPCSLLISDWAFDPWHSLNKDNEKFNDIKKMPFTAAAVFDRKCTSF